MEGSMKAQVMFLSAPCLTVDVYPDVLCESPHISVPSTLRPAVRHEPDHRGNLRGEKTGKFKSYFQGWLLGGCREGVKNLYKGKVANENIDLTKSSSCHHHIYRQGLLVHAQNSP